ncbi:MAG TPA: outer membrane beta-barrel protein [Candidatus Binatia bacterium]
MLKANGFKTAAILALLLFGPVFTHAADVAPPPPAPPAADEPKPLGPGLLSLDSSVGIVDSQIESAKGVVEKALGIGISGFFDVGYQYSGNHPRASASISGRYFDKDHNKLKFNNFNLTIDKPEKDWGVGFHFVGDFGRTGELLREVTLWNAHLKEQPSAELREAYLTFTIPFGEGIAVKAGKFVTPLGTEILPAPGAYNDNISRSFAFNFGVPITHTGALFTYPFSKAFAASGGLVTGWDNPHDNNNSPSFLGGINFTPVDAFALASNIVIGREWTAVGFNQHIHDGGTRVTLSNVVTLKPIDPLTAYLEYTMGHEEKALTPFGVRDAWWHAFAGILSYNWTDRFNTAFRSELFLDEKSARTFSLKAVPTKNSVNLYEATATAAYKFTAKLIGRVEVRHDRANKNVYQEGRNGTDNHQTTVAFQAIYGF